MAFMIAGPSFIFYMIDLLLDPFHLDVPLFNYFLFNEILVETYNQSKHLLVFFSIFSPLLH